MTEIAKFLAGFSANQVLTHGAFVLASVQFALFGIHYDRGLNMAATFVWGGVLAFCVWFAWLRDSAKSDRVPPGKEGRS